MGRFERIYSLSRRFFAPRIRKDFLRDDSGQAILEFIMLMAIAVGVVVVLKDSIRSATVKLWSGLAKRIASPCHDATVCIPEGNFDL